jgi:hypothetical protein
MSPLPTGTFKGDPRAMTSLPGWMPRTSPERHEQDVMIPEADDFGERAAVVAGGFDAANFADGAERAFGFDDEADELHDATAIFQHARFPRALEGLCEAMAGPEGGLGQWHEAVSDCLSASSLVSRRASTTPKLVWMRQPPRVTWAEVWNFRRSPPASFKSMGALACCRSS